MSLLPERDAELIALRYGADLTAKQIAEVTGMRTNAVEVALHRTLATLRQVLETGERRATRQRSGRLNDEPDPRRPAWSRHSLPVLLALSLLLPLTAVIAVAAASGGYFATSFGWTALAFAWVGVIVVVLGAPRWGTFDRIWLVGAGALCVLHLRLGRRGRALRTPPFRAGERALVYPTAVAGALLILRRGDFSRWLGGLVLGVAGVCIYSLATRLYPDPFRRLQHVGYRLFTPVGYWNALGIFAGIALLLGFGVGRARSGRLAACRLGRALVVLAPTMYFTFSRGALIAARGRHRRHVRAAARTVCSCSCALIILGPVRAFAGVLLARRLHGLTHRSATLAAASHDGRRLALELVLLVLVQAALAPGYIFASPRVRLSRACERGLNVAVGRRDRPRTGAVSSCSTDRRRRSRATPTTRSSRPRPAGRISNSRLFSLSNNGRTVLWHSAWKEFLAHPVGGSGEGGFARWWLAHRTTRRTSSWTRTTCTCRRSASSAPSASGCSPCSSGLPLVAAVRARRHPLVAPAFGGYVAYLVHCDGRLGLAGAGRHAAGAVRRRGDRRLPPGA